MVARLPLPLGVGQPISAESASPETGLHDPLLGLRLEEMSNEVAAQFGYIDIEGVLITYVTPECRQISKGWLRACLFVALATSAFAA